MKKVAILGAGNMGSAVAESLKDSEYEITCTAATQHTLDRIKASMPKVNTTLSNKDAVKDADIVILAVKPYLAGAVCEEIRESLKDEALIISLVAGFTLGNLSFMLDDDPYYDHLQSCNEDEEEMPEAVSEDKEDRKKLYYARVIPNTAIRYGKSVTFIAFDKDATHEAKDETEKIFSLSGKVFVVPEDKMTACTSLASCGIAYFLRFIRAAVEGSVEIGLKPDFATEVAALTAEGAAALIANGGHPEAEIDKVTTPGGLTIRGLNALEAHGFNAAVIAALKASAEESEPQHLHRSGWLPF